MKVNSSVDCAHLWQYFSFIWKAHIIIIGYLQTLKLSTKLLRQLAIMYKNWNMILYTGLSCDEYSWKYDPYIMLVAN